jgi:protein ImuA
VLWCEAAHAPFDVGRLYGPGLAAFGLDPARLILVTPPSAIDMLWTMEEALRLGAFAAVIGEIDGRISAFNLTATRRLQLAAEKHGHPALLLTGHAADGVSAAVTRWRVASLPSRPDEKISSIGRPRWLLSLERCRGMAAGTRLHMHDHAQEVTWNPQQLMFCDPPSARRTNGNAEATPSLVRAG